jgi:hypothetical protein
MVRVHGNYCGPNWSAGRTQPSVVSDVPAIDEFDETCKKHDAHYANGDDLYEADTEFARANIGSGRPLRVAAGFAVGLQGIGRRVLGRSRLLGLTRGGKMEESQYVEIFPDGHTELATTEELDTATPNYSIPRLRGSKMVRKNKNNNKNTPTKAVTHPTRRRIRQIDPQVGVSTKGRKGTVAVNSLQTFVKSTPTRTVSINRHGEVVAGTVFLGALETSTKHQVALDDLAVQLLVPLSPANMGNAMLGNVSRYYERFRFNRIRIHYLTASATTTEGTVVISHQVDPLNEIPTRGFNGSDLFTNLFSRENTVMGPVWENCFMDIPCHKDKWCYTDGKYGHTMEDLFAGYVIGYSSLATGTPGRLVMEFDVEFNARANNIGAGVPRAAATHSVLQLLATSAGGEMVVGNIGSLMAGNDRISTIYVDGGASNFSSSGGGAGMNDLLTTTHGFLFQEAVGAPLYVRKVDSSTWRLFITLQAAMQSVGALKSKYTTTGSTYLVVQGFETITDTPEIV